MILSISFRGNKTVDGRVLAQSIHEIDCSSPHLTDTRFLRAESCIQNLSDMDKSQNSPALMGFSPTYGIYGFISRCASYSKCVSRKILS